MSSKNSPGTLPNGLPRANTHSWRPPTGSPSDPDVVLASLPMGTPDYLRVIGAYFAKYNSQHSKKNKGVSFKTMHDRQRMVVSFFRELRHETPYRNLDPRQLANRHIEAMVARWLERRLSTATIHNYLSFLRTFAGWIGKSGMVREPEFYVGADSPHAHRSEVATEDRSWSAMNVDIAAKIAEIARFDSWVGLQLELEAGFGLRGKEARHLKPHGAIVTSDAASPRDAAAFPECRTFLHISAGSKGGRPRDPGALLLRHPQVRHLEGRARCRVAWLASPVRQRPLRGGRRRPVTGAWRHGPPSRQQGGQDARGQGARPQPRTRQHGLSGVRCRSARSCQRSCRLTDPVSREPRTRTTGARRRIPASAERSPRSDRCGPPPLSLGSPSLRRDGRRCRGYARRGSNSNGLRSLTSATSASLGCRALMIRLCSAGST